MMQHRCGKRAEVAQLLCSCGDFGPWVQVEVEDPPPSDPPTGAADRGPVAEDVAVEIPGPPSILAPAAPAAPAAPTMPASEGWACARCQRANACEDGSCIECGRARPHGGRLAIVGDLGERDLPAGSTLPVGRRRAFSPVAGPLAAFPNVAREQLVLACDQRGLVTVMDLASRNGTWLVERDRLRRLPAHTSVGLVVGSVVQLGNDPGVTNARFTVTEGAHR